MNSIPVLCGDFVLRELLSGCPPSRDRGGPRRTDATSFPPLVPSGSRWLLPLAVPQAGVASNKVISTRRRLCVIAWHLELFKCIII